MTSGKRICRLSLDDLDPVDKDTCLSTYKLASHSKIFNVFAKDIAPKPTTLRFENSDKQDSIAKERYISTKLTLHNRTPSLEEVDNRLDSKPCSIFSSAKTQDLDADVDPNEFFENFDDLVQVKYEQSKQNVKRFSPSTVKAISEELNQDIQDSGVALVTEHGKNSNQKSSEDTLNISQNLLWYLKQQTNNKLHSLEDIEPAYCLSEDKQNKKLEHRDIGTIPRWSSKRLSSKEKTEKRQWIQKELKLDDKLDYSFKDVYHLNETKQKPKRASINLNTQFKAQMNTRGDMSSSEKVICPKDRELTKRQPNLQLLRDITGQSLKEKTTTSSYGSYLFGEKVQEPQIVCMLKNLQEKTDQISESMLMKLKGSNLESMKNLSGVTEDEESACKKLNFTRETCFTGYKKGRLPGAMTDYDSRSRVKTVNQTMMESSGDGSFDGYLERVGRRSASSQNK